ncbi:manganese-dependent inorganic pyrophosphatase [Slackia equolifaciens]|uniref:inorganic diphosphatase n=1 Tax=Slackia equolifaciens TaxID=498718 RepID=A0A3N0AZB1_9ACTN|nr:manganese-dependent inorganic pyrophosphatase [Slackia equolifaciens]RNL39904.1 manganese-dependent inorganic pyrophosphatase [Slackia equolifaciens]
MTSPILVFGHKNPDNDAISAAVGYAYLKNELARKCGENVTYEACRLGGLPPETEWILGENGIEAPRLIDHVGEGDKVILVDHNEALQSADGLDAAEIVEIVDHHRIGGLVTANPIRFNNMPIGSTAAIVAREFEIQGVELPKNIAAVLLGAMLTDTVIMKSPTTTPLDCEIIERTAKIVGVDPVEYGMSIFKCRSNPAEMPVEKIIGADAKEFPLADGSTVFIVAFETVDLQAVMDREQEIREAMRAVVADKGYKFMLLMATDILAEGSNFICEGDCELVNRVFDIDVEGKAVWMPGVLSRKKQVAAPILAAK